MRMEYSGKGTQLPLGELKMNSESFMRRIFFFLLLVACVNSYAQRVELDLSGEWNTELGSCKLPGTTDENRLGSGEHDKNITSQLTRLYPYTGTLVYEKNITIGKEMEKKDLMLYMERTKPSTLWIDGDSIGSISLLLAPHIYYLPKLKAGTHNIKIRIDNRNEAVPKGVLGSHAWTDATQTNWNGILGKFAIIGTDYAYIKSVNIYPDIKNKSANVRVNIYSKQNWTLPPNISIKGNEIAEQIKKINIKRGDNNVDFIVQLGDSMKLWSEFHPYLYNITVNLNGRNCADEKQVKFGMREFGTEGTQFTINGLKTFMRGTHDACVFPIYAYCSTDVNEWKKVFRRAKEYGINHYRFHSYTPTKAAFEAADEEGIYLQTELPLWGSIDSTTVAQNDFLLKEAKTAIDFLGNHPSFMSLGLGNELWGDVNMMHKWLDEFRKLDSRHLYCYGSNNFLGWRGASDGEDYFVTCRVGGGDHYKTNTRTSFSFADEDDGGILNHVRPNTRDDFSYPVKLCPRPIIAHETCQFQMYPDYEQIKNYTGVLYPYNLEIFRDRLNENGLEKQATDFTIATNKWGIECYKADIEYCVRTKGFGGYQLLDLKDYPGQGSALCGILDVFMHQKDKADYKVKNVMQPVVPLALMDKLCWRYDESFKADIMICNYTENDWDEELYWEWTNGDKVIIEGSINSRVTQGDIASIGSITSVPASSDPMMLTLKLKTGTYANEYNVWFYPNSEKRVDKKQIVFADTLDKKTLKALKKGKTVLLTPDFHSIEKQSIAGLFTPDYWNYAMFKSISENNKKPVSPGSLGMMMNKNHSLFEEFPTEGYSDWQWWCIAKNSRPLILNTFKKDYYPLIQTVDNVERNHKLGILMEFKVGKGKLLISTTDLYTISDYVEGRQYCHAILNYITSSHFNPTTEITEEELRTILYSEVEVKDIQGVKNISDYNKK